MGWYNNKYWDTGISERDTTHRYNQWDGYTDVSEELPYHSEQVDSPAHYTTGGIETIVFIRAKLGLDGFRSYCIGNVLKYASRWQDKGGVVDLEKAAKYAEWAAKGDV